MLLCVNQMQMTGRRLYPYELKPPPDWEVSPWEQVEAAPDNSDG